MKFTIIFLLASAAAAPTLAEEKIVINDEGRREVVTTTMITTGPRAGCILEERMTVDEYPGQPGWGSGHVICPPEK